MTHLEKCQWDKWAKRDTPVLEELQRCQRSGPVSRM